MLHTTWNRWRGFEPTESAPWCHACSIRVHLGVQIMVSWRPCWTSPQGLWEPQKVLTRLLTGSNCLKCRTPHPSEGRSAGRGLARAPQHLSRGQEPQAHHVWPCGCVSNHLCYLSVPKSSPIAPCPQEPFPPNGATGGQWEGVWGSRSLPRCVWVTQDKPLHPFAAGTTAHVPRIQGGCK